jgi:hypothetical protein
MNLLVAIFLFFLQRLPRIARVKIQSATPSYFCVQINTRMVSPQSQLQRGTVFNEILWDQ